MSREDVPVCDAPTREEFRSDVIRGLGRREKVLPSKYLYDERGSELFERICDLEEYYPTRTEIAILERSGEEMAERLGERCKVIEPGSGSGLKTRLLLDRLRDPVGYVPVEISPEFLARSVAELSEAYPELEILPVCADFTADFDLPVPKRTPRRRVVFFPGSTIGNLHPEDAVAFLARLRRLVGRGGAVLIGVDLEKDAATLERAYDDREGVTAEFDLNLLDRINRELGADFHREAFRHEAIYDAEHHRVEMHLVSRRDQTVHLGGESFPFHHGEVMVTEYSYKYSEDRFRDVAARAGLPVVKVWTDPKRLFSVQLCEAD